MTHPSDADFEAWAYALLEPHASRTFEAHVGECETCARRLAEVARLSEFLDEAAARSRRVSRGQRLGAFALAAAAILALLRWPTPAPPAGTVEDVHTDPLPPERLREQRRQLESVGRIVQYEALPDPAYQPDEQ